MSGAETAYLKEMKFVDFVRFEVFTAVKMSCCYSGLKMKAVSSSENLVSTYKFTPCYDPEV
jgi:hypothetical protein